MRFTELTRLGDGPVATVYSGQQDGVPVALKVFPKRFDKRTMTAFIKERAVLAGLHRVASILPVDAVDEVDGRPALRMELCPDSLASVVEHGGPLPAADVLALGRAVALALAAAHDVGVVHGGLSPHNLLFRASGEPVVSDFGLTLREALARDPLHAIEFLPPETLRTGTLTRSTDLYGLGALLHYALVGRTPHPGRLGEQPGERVLRILGKPVPAINARDVPVALATLVARLLAADPVHRPDDATQVAAQLAGLLPDDPPRPEADFDDFAGAPPAPPQTSQPPPQPSPGPPDELDDFAMPHPSSGPAPPSPEPVTRETRLWDALARNEKTRQEPAPPPQVPQQLAGMPPREVLAWEAPVRDALRWDGRLQHEQTREMPARQESPEASGGIPPVEQAPTQETRLREVSGWAGPFRAMPVAAPATPGRQAGGPEMPAREDLGTDEPPTAAESPPPEVPAHEEPDWDEPFWEMPDTTDEAPDPRASEHPAPVRQELAWDEPAGADGRRNTRAWRVWAGVGGGMLAGALSVVLVLLIGAEPDELASSPREPGDGGVVVGDVRVELSPPVDRNDRVELSWNSTRELDFAVVVAAEGKKTQVHLAHRKKAMTVDVEPGVKYCFMIQGTDSDRVYESQSVPLRGATCRK